MFSGIVKEIGTIQSLNHKDGILELDISFNNKDINIGDSVAVNGCCLTVVEQGYGPWTMDYGSSAINHNPSAIIHSPFFKVQATQETLSKTNLNNLKVGSKVNLETSLKIGDKLDGHLVMGHIDSCGEVLNIFTEGENTLVEIKFPDKLKNFIAPKGSITVNGVSLTVVGIGLKPTSTFSFTLIPYTRDNTNLGLIKVGDLVNLEIDSISRYVVNYLEHA